MVGLQTDLWLVCARCVLCDGSLCALMPSLWLLVQAVLSLCEKAQPPPTPPSMGTTQSVFDPEQFFVYLAALEPLHVRLRDNHLG